MTESLTKTNSKKTKDSFLAVVATSEGLMLLESGAELNGDFVDNDHHKKWILNLFNFDLASRRRIAFAKASSFLESKVFELEDSDELAIDFEPIESKAFFEVVNESLNEMKNGSLQKIVPCVFETGTTALAFRDVAMALMRRLQQSALKGEYENSFPYAFIDFENTFALMGLTPELLFSSDEMVLKTMALAGTFFENKGMTREEFLVDPKETFEHRIVVSDIKERLKDFGEISTGPMILKRVGRLEHLLTDLKIKLIRKPHFLECIRALHPTAALGVYPKSKLSEWSDKLSCGVDRKHFGSPFGVETPDQQFHCYVAIRNIEISASNIRIGAGCGIIETSDAAKEWQELYAKRNAVKRIFNL